MPIKYIPYTPEPIEGQALLDNFTRTLRYKGNYDIKGKLIRGMPLYEMQTVETFGDKEKAKQNLVIRGECVSACAYLKEKGILVDLVYIDPPFASGADYSKTVYIRQNPKLAKALKQAEEELEIEDLKSFEEKIFQDYDEKYIARFKYKDPDGRLWDSGNPTAKGLQGGGYDYEYDGYRTLWRYPYETLKKMDEEGRLYRTKNGGIRTKVYLDELKGMPCQALWTDINAVNSQADERIDYATQKPEALLERIIKASSDENMIVADFFGGSGVTAAVANKLNRRFIHCDVGINSIQTVRDRLIAQKETPNHVRGDVDFSVLEIKDGVSLFRNPVQTMEKLKSLVPGLGKMEGLSDFWAGCIESIKDGTVPVYLPDLKNSECKILDKPFMSRILHEHLGNLPFTPTRVIIYYVDVADISEIEEFVKADKSTLAKIEFRDLKQLLDDIVIEDTADFEVSEVQEELIPEYKLTVKSFMSDRVMRHINAYNQKCELNSKGKKFKPIVISEEGLELIEWLSVDCTATEGEWHSDSEIKIDKLGFVIKNGIKTKDFWDGTIKSETKPMRLKIRNICGDDSVWKV